MNWDVRTTYDGENRKRVVRMIKCYRLEGLRLALRSTIAVNSKAKDELSVYAPITEAMTNENKHMQKREIVMLMSDLDTKNTLELKKETGMNGVRNMR
jgi:hypothetical protein